MIVKLGIIITRFQDRIKNLESLFFGERFGLSGSSANPSLSIEHGLVRPRKARAPIRSRYRRVANVGLGEP